MRPERWQRVYEMFADALDAEPDARAASVRRACVADASLEAEVLALLAAHDAAVTDEFLEVPPWILDDVAVMLPDFAGYERIEYIGHGGMGVVYRAFQRSLDRWVALKMALPRGHVADDGPRRFRTEAENMARLRNANVVRVHEVGDVDGRPYFSMELIEGGSLASDLGRFGGDPHSAAVLVETVARAVDHAHRRGLLHRDLKPGNILVDEEGQPHITDFGLARSVDAPTGRREAIGTAGYMSPEQADPERDETVRSDVYGLGAILYALLTARAPHQGRDRKETLQLVRERAAERPSAINARVDPDLQAVCLKALAREPEERHASAAAFAADLRRWLGGDETSARRWPVAERWRRRIHRNPVLAWLGIATAILLVASTAFVVDALVGMARQPALAEQALARQQAETVRLRLLQLAQAVESAADDPALGRMVLTGDVGGLQRAIQAIAAARVDLSGDSPFESWFVVTLDGRMVARWPELPHFDEQDVRFGERDYFSGALRSARGAEPRRAYISRVYFGYASTRYNFGIARALFDATEPLGVLAASVTTSPALGLATGGRGPSTTALIARVDPSRISPDTPPYVDHVLLVHPAYRRGASPLPMPGAVVDRDGIDERYLDPAAAIDPSFGGTWLAGFAPVADAPFVVVSQRKHDAGASIELWGAGVALGLVALVVLWRIAHRRREPGHD